MKSEYELICCCLPPMFGMFEQNPMDISTSVVQLSLCGNNRSFNVRRPCKDKIRPLSGKNSEHIEGLAR